MRILILISGLLVAAGVDAAPFPSPSDWRDENIYQIFTDRFADGDPSNNNLESGHGSPYAPTDSTGIHGGDFKGIQQKLDYIKSLGASAIWISPIPLNVGGNSAYHGYAAQDFYSLAPHWGTMADLSNMVSAAHARGIKVILDVVVNHSGDLIGSTDPGYPAYMAPPAGYNMIYWDSGNKHAPPFLTNSAVPTLSSLFHTNGAIGDAVLGELFGLDDFRTETTYVRTNMVNIYTNWVGRADFDGFRVDTAKHVDYGFWQYWCPQLHQFGSSIGKSNLFMFGEAFDGSESVVGSYTGAEGGGPFKLDSMLDYPLYFTINPVFAIASGNTQQIVNHYNSIAANYDSNAWYRLVTFLDNHDTTRFLSSGNANNDTNRLAVALEFLYTSRGIPCLYYGTEEAFNGGGDPNNREDMFAGQFEQTSSLGDNFNMTHPLFRLVAKLNNFRRLYPSLRRGVHNNLWSDPSGPGLFAYSRALSNEEVFVVLNTASSSQTLTNRPTSYPVGTVLVNLLDTNETVVVNAATNTPLITVPGTTAKIFVAQTLVEPLDPVVVSQTPAHATSVCSPATPVVLQFSKPMDTNSVQAAFSVTPASPGTFTWSTFRDTLTFTPSAPGWSGETNFVHLATNAMDSVSGNAVYAPFDTYFVVQNQPFVISTSSSPADGGTTSGGGTHPCNESVTVTAIPNGCYGFLNWTENGTVVSTSAAYSFDADTDRTLVAHFVPGHTIDSQAADNAADPAYASGFADGSNGGTGLQPWVLKRTFGNANCNGFFIDSSIATLPHTPPGIDINGKSWGLYANGVYCGGASIAAEYRAFDIGPLQVSGQVMIDMANGYNDNSGSVVGFTLRNGNTATNPSDYAAGARFQFYLAGLSNNYTVVDAAGTRDSGIPVTLQGLHLVFTLGTNDSYTLGVTTYGDGAINLITGTLAGSVDSTLDSIALFNNNNGTDSSHDVFFNSLLLLNLAPLTSTNSVNINTTSSPLDGGTTSGGGTVNCGSNVTVCASTNAGYTFVDWTENGDVVSFSSCYTFTAFGDRTLVANFSDASVFGFFDNVENGTNGWSAAGLWHIVGPGACSNSYSPTHSWYYGTNSTCTYDTGVANSGDLISPPFVVPASGTLTFQSWEQTESASTSWDKRIVYLTTNSAASWIQLLQSVNNASAWYQVSIGLSAYADKTAQLRFHFETVDSVANAYHGWNVDDVRVAGPPSLAITPAASFDASGEQGGPFAPPAQVYTLSNAGIGTLSWSASVSNSWMSLSETNGILGTGASTNLTVSVNSTANVLVGGLYSNVVSFVNTTNGGGSADRVAMLLVRDGIDDAWRQQYFDHIDPRASDQSRAEDDPDGDGCNNLCEFLGGTDPTNSASSLRILSVVPEANDLRITWLTAGGKTNVVQAAPDLLDGYFDVSSNLIINGTGDTVTNFLDVGAATNVPARFYRVWLVP
jgi:alpha-amylase